MRIEPPPSLPMATGVKPSATLAPAPPLEPPGVQVRSHGFHVRPRDPRRVLACGDAAADGAPLMSFGVPA